MTKRSNLIDYLRGIAIIFVVLDHLFVWLGLNALWPFWHNLLIYSVTPLIFLAGYTFQLSFLKRPPNFNLNTNGKFPLFSFLKTYLTYFYHKAKKIIIAYTLGLFIIILWQQNFSWQTYWHLYFTFPNQFYFIIIYLQLLFIAPLISSLWTSLASILPKINFFIKYGVICALILLASLLFNRYPVFSSQIYYPGQLLFGGLQLWVFSMGSLCAYLVTKKIIPSQIFTMSNNLLGGAIILVYLFFSHNQNKIFAHPPNYFTILYCLGTTAIFSFIYLSLKKFKLNFIIKITEYLGKHSLAIFIYHSFFISELIKKLPISFFNSSIYLQIILISFITIVSSIILTYIIDFLLAYLSKIFHPRNSFS